MMEYKGFTTTMNWSEEYGVFHGKVDIPGKLRFKDLISFEGKTEDEFIELFHKAVDDYIRFTQEGKSDRKEKFNFKSRFIKMTEKKLDRLFIAVSLITVGMSLYLLSYQSKNIDMSPARVLVNNFWIVAVWIASLLSFLVIFNKNIK